MTYIEVMASLSMDQIRKRAATFVRSWNEEEGYERGQAQSFVRDLLRVYGITETKAAAYEARAARASTGGHGYVDALISGLLLIEMKSKGADLEQAEKQATDYLEGLTDAESPRWVLTSDFTRFRLLDLHSEGQPVVEFTLRELGRRPGYLAFLAGFRRSSFGSKVQEQASIKAAQIMADLYVELEKSRYPLHSSSVFLVRVLFCLYADDSGLWERDLFQEFLRTRTREDGTDLGTQLTGLFQILDQHPDARVTQDDLLLRFPYVNGEVFTERIDAPWFDQKGRQKLLDAARFNWAEISPAIFGSLFQAVKDKKARRELGEHYTTETNVLRLIRPLFLDGLRERYRKNYHSTQGLTMLRNHLGELRFADMAMGCGNFLLLTYRELRRLELDILIRQRELSASPEREAQSSMTTDVGLKVRKGHFYGIELEEWPATIARTALYFAEHQANQDMAEEFGEPPALLPLDDATNFVVGNALSVDWRAVLQPTEHTYIIGNPPFLGDHRGKQQTADLKTAWGKTVTVSRMDYVTGWYKKAIDFFGEGKGRFAFVSTNSVTQGDQTARLFGPLFRAGWRISFAHQTFTWTSEAPKEAAVHCVIIGFDKRVSGSCELFSYEDGRSDPVGSTVPFINAYLFSGPDVLVEKESRPISGELCKTSYGSKPTDDGNLLVEVEDYPAVSSDPIASQYLRPFVGAHELLNNGKRWCLWLVDAVPVDIRRSPILKQRVEGVRSFRAESEAESTREYPYHHLFRQLAAQETDYVCIPRHVSGTFAFFPVALLPASTIASDATFTLHDPDGFQFGVLSSSMFMTWQKTVGGRYKSDPRFGSTLTWYTLPLPTLTEAQREAVIEGGRAVRSAREQYPERSLADHYDPLSMSPGLVQAHERLDSAVDRAFGSKRRYRDNLARRAALFSLYQETRTVGQL